MASDYIPTDLEDTVILVHKEARTTYSVRYHGKVVLRKTTRAKCNKYVDDLIEKRRLFLIEGGVYHDKSVYTP